MADFELLAPGGHQKLVDEVVDRLDLKADIDGYYAQLTAGAADNLTGRGDATTAEFLYRTSGGTADIETGQAVAKSIKGNTLVWNQLAINGNFADGPYHWMARQSTLTVADGVATLVPNSAGAERGLQASSYSDAAVAGHKYLISTEFNTSEATNLLISFSGINPITVVVPSTGVWHKCGGIWTNSSNVSGVFPYLITSASVTTSAQLKYRNIQVFDLTQMFGAGNEPSTVAEFEALFPQPYYEYDAGSLLSVSMEGVETVGFNQWDGETANGYWDAYTGEFTPSDIWKGCKTHIPCFPNTTYYYKIDAIISENVGYIIFYDASKGYLSSLLISKNSTFTTPANAHYMTFYAKPAYFADGADPICINLSWSGRRNGEYEPYWSSQRLIDVATYFPDGMRSAGTVRDELTSTEAITRVGVVDLGSLTWIKGNALTDGTGSVFYTQSQFLPVAGNFADAKLSKFTFNGSAAVSWESLTKGEYYSGNSWLVIGGDSALTTTQFKESLNGVMLHYALATPVVTAIDPALNLSYRVDDFGTERIVVPEDERSAPPVLDIAYGLNVVDFVRRAPTQYISAASFAQYLLARDAHDGTTTTMTWDYTDNRYEFAITDVETEG